MPTPQNDVVWGQTRTVVRRPEDVNAMMKPTPAPTARVVHDLALDGLARSRTVRLLSVPSHHPYIAAVTPTSVQLVEPDRVLTWEPDPIFTPGALTRLAGQADLVHLHFSFDHLDVPSVRAWLAELHTTGLPLVLTAHDLRNPHHDTRSRHDQLLAELLPASAAVLTLTDGAAREIATRFGIPTTVLPHPSLVDPTRTANVPTEPGLAVVHLKSLRRNLLDPLRIVAAAAAGANRAGGRLRVDLHPEVANDPRLGGLAELARATGVELVEHLRFDDLAFERYLRRAHVTVLPYRWGTHSGWLELARDLGTRVVAPDCGYYTDQWSDVVTYGNNETTGLDPESLAAAVATALLRPPPAPAERSVRLAEVTAVRRAHEAIYRQVVAAGVPRTSLR